VSVRRRALKLQCLRERTGGSVRGTYGLGGATNAHQRRERVIRTVIQLFPASELLHNWYDSRGIIGIATDENIILQFLNSNVYVVRDELEVLTWVRSFVGEKVNTNSELHGGEYVQDARDLFVLHRYRVSSAVMRMSGRVQTGGGR